MQFINIYIIPQIAMLYVAVVIYIHSFACIVAFRNLLKWKQWSFYCLHPIHQIKSVNVAEQLFNILHCSGKGIDLL